MIGQIISHYKILEKLGEGGMGVVYKAEDTKLDRIVALKFLPHSLIANEAEKARFLQEAKAASALNHPNVCTIYDIKEEDGQQFIVMEYVDGKTLRQILPVKKLDEAYGYAIQIGEALQEAHAKGIVHRDIKADNIMVNSKNQIKVMDFGLAKLKGSLKLTRTSSTVGTLAYMAPEQIQGSDVDGRSDIFSFGVVLFEMLTGHLPFRGEHEAALMYSIINEEPESLQKYIPDVSPELLHILNSALEKNPEDRYQSVSEMVRDLRRLQKQSTKVTRASMPAMKVPDLGSLTTDEHEISRENSELPSNSKRSKTILLIGGISIFILTAVAVLFYVSTKNKPIADFQSMKITRMTTIGTAGNATISPDGKYIVHTVLKDGKLGLWVRQVATSSNVEIVPAAVTTYLGTTFSNDGNYIYYVIQDSANPSGSLFQVPVLGGTSKRILTNIRTPISLSPDGKQCTFVRQNNEAKNEEALMIVNLDGSGERKLVSRFGEEFFLDAEMGPSWSSNGKYIATCVATTKGGFQCRIAVYTVNDGKEEFLSSRSWRSMGRVAWLHDCTGIIVSAIDTTVVRPQLWHLAFPSGEVRRITNDLNSYDLTSLSLTENDEALISVQAEVSSNIWIVPDGNAAQAKKITFGSGTLDGAKGISCTPDGSKIVYTSMASGSPDIWVLDSDGNNQKQLTTGSAGDFVPKVVPNGRGIIFASSQTGTSNIWKMDLDGSNMKRITTTEDYAGQSTPDGKWVVYSGFGAGFGAIWKVSADGGSPVQLTKKVSVGPSVSPDGKLIACAYENMPNELPKIAIISIDGGESVKLLDLPVTATWDLSWISNGKEISYINTIGGVGNIWSQPIDGSASKQITNFTEGLIFSFDWTADGKQLACARGNVVNDVVMITGFR